MEVSVDETTRFKVLIAWEGGDTWDWFECEMCAHRFRDYKYNIPRQCPLCMRYGREINKRGSMSLTGHELTDYLFKRYPPQSDDVNHILDMYMEMFADLGHYISDTTAVTPEQALALRALHDAHRAAIFAVVAHQ